MGVKELRELERAIVCALHQAMRGEPLTCTRLVEQVGGSRRSLVVRHLLGELHSAGVVEVAGERVRLSAAVRQLALLGLLASGESRERSP